MKHLFGNFWVSKLFMPLFALMLMFCGMGSAKAYNLFIYNADWQPLDFTLATGTYCWGSDWGGGGSTPPGQNFLNAAPGSYTLIKYGMYQGDCTNSGLIFSIDFTKPDQTKASQSFFGEKYGNIVATNTANHYEGTLGGPYTQNGSTYFIYTSKATPLPQPSSKPVGFWNPICGSVGCELKVETTASTNLTKTKIYSVTDRKSITMGVQVGVDYKFVSGQVSVEGTLAQDITNELGSSFESSQGTSVSHQVSISKEYMKANGINQVFQWGAKTILPSGEVVNIMTTRYACTSYGEVPDFVPGDPRDPKSCIGGLISNLRVNQSGNGSGTVQGTSVSVVKSRVTNTPFAGPPIYCTVSPPTVNPGTGMLNPGSICSTDPLAPGVTPLFTDNVVTLTATAASGSTFVGWGEDCSGQPASKCVLTLDVNKNVTANFNISSFTLTVTRSGTGSGSVSGSGIDCGSSCSASFIGGTSVILTASPATGSTFTGWSGGCTGTGNCAVTMGAAQNVTATFASAPATPGVSLNPSSLTFADQRIGTTSPAQSITLTNTGIGALTITSILSTTPVFSVTNNCGGGLAAGASCSLGVTFTPVAAGTRVGSIAVTSNTAGSPHSVTVSGVNLASIAPDCTLSASPPSVSKNGSSTLTASCSPAATSYVWTGGTCVVTTAATCSVTPTSNTSYTVQGANSAGKSNVASATVSVLPDSAIGLYDGIYVWSDGNYLSLHQDGSQMIATIYFNDNTSVDFKAASGGPVKVPQLDIFDLLSGAVTGATAKISGTRFHRACNVAYDFAFSNSSKLTVTRTNVSNTAIATASGISCSSIIANESPTMTMSKVPFGALAGSTPALAVGQYDGIYVWSDGNYLSLHQDGADFIATIYFNDNTSVDFRAASGGVLTVPQLDVFDLLSGSVTGSTSKIKGTRFHRACNVTYDFNFSGNVNLTATRTGISNTPLADAAGISCSAMLGSESGTISMRKIPFGQ